MIANPLDKGLGDKIEAELISLDQPKKQVSCLEGPAQYNINLLTEIENLQG